MFDVECQKTKFIGVSENSNHELKIMDPFIKAFLFLSLTLKVIKCYYSSHEADSVTQKIIKT